VPRGIEKIHEGSVISAVPKSINLRELMSSYSANTRFSGFKSL